MPTITALSEFHQPLLIAQKTGHRLMLVVAMEEASGLSIAKQITRFASACLWVDVLNTTTVPVPEHHYISTNQTKQHLGTSNQYVIYNAHKGFNASALCALSGTVVGGGALILLVPAIAQWHHLFDSQLQAYGHLKSGAHSYFIKWWQQHWEHCAVHVLEGSAYNHKRDDHNIWQQLDYYKAANLLHPTQDQKAVIDKLLSSYQQSINTVFNLSAHRGRGKSACLGWLIKAISTQSKKTQQAPVIVTAPSKKALSTLSATATPALVNFYALDALLTQLPKASLVIVDEAASLPLSQLTKLIQHYDLVVLSSTQDGYEGSGQGYRLKLPRIIESLGLTSESLTLTQPMRWHANDPLEDFIRSSFLCDVRLPNIEQQSFIDSTSSLTYSHTCGEELAQDSRLLKQVYALLMLAHYQTTPQDLRLLLDHPKQKLYLCYKGGCLVALAWVSQEGALDADLAEQIALGKRRIQGHLLAQILTQQAGFPESCEMHSWRIQRIVVLPQLQNTGVGAALLNHVYTLAQEDNIDFLGTSFSASVDTLRFWLANQYIPAWLGLRADAATGLNSVQLIRPISINAHTLAGNLSHHLYGYLSFGKDFWFRSIDKKVLLIIATNCEKNTTPALDQMQKKRLLKLLALGQAGFSGGLYLLYQQLKDAKDKQEVLHAAHNNTHKGLQKSVRRLALLQVEPSYNQ